LPIDFDGRILKLFKPYLVDAQVIVERLSTGQRDKDKLRKKAKKKNFDGTGVNPIKI
jgi:hypothetical protein